MSGKKEKASYCENYFIFLKFSTFFVPFGIHPCQIIKRPKCCQLSFVDQVRPAHSALGLAGGATTGNGAVALLHPSGNQGNEDEEYGGDGKI